MPQLDPSLFATQLFWLFVTFMVLFLIAWKVALPRIADVLNARQNRIDSDLERAQTLKSEAEDVLSAYEKALAEATAEAQDIHRQNLQELAAERTRRQEELARRLSGQTRDAESRISAERQRAVDNIREATLDVVRSAAARLIGGTVAEADADRAIRAVQEERRS
jgi:F-type H+-transporting ATPase subunit b